MSKLEELAAKLNKELGDANVRPPDSISAPEYAEINGMSTEGAHYRLKKMEREEKMASVMVKGIRYYYFV